MQTSKRTIELIRDWEGERLKAYKCPAGVWTIGVGHTKTAKAGMTITREESERLLISDLVEFENGVKRLVRVALTQNQFDALVSLAFNIGIGNLASSRLLKFVNLKQFGEAGNAFLSWNKARVNGKLVPLAGLTRRRNAERQLFLTK